MHSKKIYSDRAAYQYDSDESIRILRGEKANTGVLRSEESPRREHDRHHGVHHYCVIFKKA